ncbi:MAG: hypothetical protein HFG82_05595 [Dorea sp.]|jgi:hypothetical protein|nr:hypothetical protein [Dorea sp.]
MSQETKDENGKERKKLFIIVCVLIIVIFSGIMLFFNLKKDEIEKRNVVVNPKNAEEIAEQMINEDYVEAGYYTVSMDTNWHFDKGDAVSDNARVNNLAENTNDVYFDVFLKENESDAIYKSPVIPRGGYLEKIALDQPLSKGTYDCIIVYHLVDEEQETISTLRVSFTITVES